MFISKCKIIIRIKVWQNGYNSSSWYFQLSSSVQFTNVLSNSKCIVNKLFTNDMWNGLCTSQRKNHRSVSIPKNPFSCFFLVRQHYQLHDRRWEIQCVGIAFWQHVKWIVHLSKKTSAASVHPWGPRMFAIFLGSFGSSMIADKGSPLCQALQEIKGEAPCRNICDKSK